MNPGVRLGVVFQMGENPDIQALMGMTQEELAQLSPEAAAQVQELISQAQAAADQADKDRQARLQGLGQRIVGQYHERVGLRREIEERWLRDIRRYNGQYEAKFMKVLESREFGSRAFVPLTRRIVNIVEARWFDLIFPTAERNYAVVSSPVPTMAEAGRLAEKLPPEAEVPAGPNGEPVRASAVAMAIREIREAAQRSADGMQREVDDQLRECNYPAQARRAMHDALVLGTGILKGPHVVAQRQKVWANGSVQVVERLVPVGTHVPAWNFYPDMSAARIADSESDIEVHRMSRSQLAQLARQPGFEAAGPAIAELMRVEGGSVSNNDQRQEELREPSGTAGVKDPRHVILEYHGPVTTDELADLGVSIPDESLMVYEGILWIAESTGAVLKAAIEPLDTQERPYSVLCWEEDPACIFGFGLSHECSDTQEAANSSFRGAMDNMGLSVGAQTVVNDKLIVPDNGKWILEPNKVWRMKKQDADARAAFAFHQVDSRLEELLALFDRSKAIMDDIGGPAMAMQGQDAPSYLDTARGASIAWNSSNIWMRRGARSWDDNITSTLVQRFVDWNLQYNPKPEIKGDLQVMARGSTDLLEAEGLVPKLGYFLEAVKDIPMPLKRRVAQARVMARGLRIDDADTLPDDAEVEKIQENLDKQGPPPNPELERVKLRQAELQDNSAQRQHELGLKQMEYQLRMAELASANKMTADEARAKFILDSTKIQADLANAREQRSFDAQALNAELAVKAAKGSGI